MLARASGLADRVYAISSRRLLSLYSLSRRSFVRRPAFVPPFFTPLCTAYLDLLPSFPRRCCSVLIIYL
jgi:hypothetical protein